MDFLNPAIPAEIEERADEMPTFSPIIGKLEQLRYKTNASPRDFVEIVMLDPVLTGKVIQLVNSSFYGVGQQVRSLSQAILLLGINTVKNLALSTVMLSTLFTKGKWSPVNPQAFWHHCLGTAVCSKFLARSLGVPSDDAEAFFVAGLIHDIGKVLFINTDPFRYGRAMEESRRLGVSLAFAELSHFGCDHTHVGGLLARKWRLGHVLTEVIEMHHDFPETLQGRERLLITISNNLCKGEKIGDSGNNVIEEMGTELSDSMRLGRGTLEQATDLLSGEIEKADMFLSVFDGGVS